MVRSIAFEFDALHCIIIGRIIPEIERGYFTLNCPKCIIRLFYDYIFIVESPYKSRISCVICHLHCKLCADTVERDMEDCVTETPGA